MLLTNSPGRVGIALAVLMLLPGHGAAESASPVASAPAEESGDGVPADKIDELVAPIALYPDVLVSQILPASTFPVDIVKAARWLRSKPDMSTLGSQEWDLSVLSLCHYPEVIYKMDQDLDWTSALGATFMDQPRDVMDAVQRLRLRAQSSGALKTTEQQTVVVEKETIRIVPSQPQVVYVPTYNPQVVYVQQQPSAATVATASAISFGVGMAMGTWLHNDCDWHTASVVYCKPGYWGGYGYRGAVAWNDNWAAAVGPRRAAVVGEDGGAYVGPRGAAVWGENGHGAAWRRSTPYGAPAYGGRYSSYNNYGGAAASRRTAFSGNTAYRGNTAIGNDVTFNRNIDRGDRNTAIGGDRTTGIRGDRTPGAGVDRRPGAVQRPGGPTQLPAGGDRRPGTGVDRPGAGQRPATPSQLPAGPGSARPGGGRSPGSPSQLPSSKSAFSGGAGRDASNFSQRGQQSRQTSASQLPSRSPSAAQRPSPGSTSGSRSSPSARPGTGSSSRQSPFSSFSGSSQARSQSSRGSSSRSSAGISRGGGGFRGGGGRGRR